MDPKAIDSNQELDEHDLVPPTLDHVLGQEAVLKRLRIAVSASWADGLSLDHVLLTGGPGLGKTMLAKVLSRELVGSFIPTIGQSLWSTDALNGYLLQAETRNSIMFVDEAHLMGRDAQTAMLKAIDERVVYLSDFSGDGATSIQLPPITIILATTNPELLLTPLRDRMRLNCQLSRYECSDLVAIIRQKASQLGWPTEDGALMPIAERSIGTPRLAINLLRSARRVTRAKGDVTITMADTEAMFTLEEIDALGLNKDQQNYLAILAESSAAIRISSLAYRMGQHPAAISGVVEPSLIYLGLVERAERGRVLTAKGLRHVRKSASSAQS